MVITVQQSNTERHVTLPDISDVLTKARRFLRFRTALSEALLTADNMIIKAVIIQHYVGHQLTTEQISDIMPHMDDITIDSFPPEIWTPEPLIHFTRFIWPKRGMETSTYREFFIMDGYLEDILQEHGDIETNMYGLLATILRPVSKDKSHILRTGDKRIPLVSREQTLQWGAWLKDAGTSWIYRDIITCALAQAFTYAIAMKVFLRATYGQWLFEKTSQQTDSSDPDFGWTSVCMRVAKTGLFGDVQGVLDTMCHEVFVHLVDSKVEHDRHLRHLKQLETQNR